MPRRLTLSLLAAAALTALAASPALAAVKCDDFVFQEDAQAAYEAGATNLDHDKDGKACERLPHRSSSGGKESTSGSTGTGDDQTGTGTGTDTGDDGTGDASGGANGDELPLTGAANSWLAMATAALLSAGGALVWRLRYRPAH